MSDIPWYHEGLRFTCTACGDCCTGAPGFVWLNKMEIEALAAGLAMEVAQFEETCVRQVGIRKSLLERPNGDCIFFDPTARNCSVYNLRPHQCRTWPFWASNLRLREIWEQVCEVCPGAGKGRLVAVDEIERYVGQRRV